MKKPPPPEPEPIVGSIRVERYVYQVRANGLVVVPGVQCEKCKILSRGRFNIDGKKCVCKCGKQYSIVPLPPPPEATSVSKLLYEGNDNAMFDEKENTPAAASSLLDDTEATSAPVVKKEKKAKAKKDAPVKSEKKAKAKKSKTSKKSKNAEKAKTEKVVKKPKATSDDAKFVTAKDATAREGSVSALVLKTFKSGKTRSAGIEACIKAYEGETKKSERSASYATNPAGYISWYIGSLIKSKKIVAV